MIPNQDLELSSESTSASGTHILDLNFNCLHAIFSLKCFTMLDLCSIGETHYRFKEVVDNVFDKQVKNYEVDLWNHTVLETTTRVLSNFGPFITKLLIDGQCNEKLTQFFLQLLDLVIEHCSTKLESIVLIRCTITEAETIKLKQIFDKLLKTSLPECTIYSGKTLFSKCESLVELKLYDVKLDDQHLLLENTFPKLDRLEYWDDYSTSGLFGDSNKSNDFFSRHQNLKSLILDRSIGISHLLPGIADNCKQLAELDITFEEDEVEVEKALTSILTFEYLNYLEIDCHGRNITKFIEKLKDLRSLEILILWFVDGDSELVSSLTKITRLRVLELFSCDGLTNLNPLADLERLTELKIQSNENLDFDLVRMIKRLNNLTFLYFDVESFSMDKKMYLRIVDAVRERPGRFQDALQISCYTNYDGSENSFGDGDRRKLVRIFEINSDSDSDMDFD